MEKGSFEYLSTKTLYVCDAILTKLFCSAYPAFYSTGTADDVVLSDYFEYKKVDLKIDGIHSGIRPKACYYKMSDTERGTLFLTLSHFLTNYHRPYRSCLVNVPNHISVKQDPMFVPLVVHQPKPVYPSFSENRNYFIVDFDEDLYCDVIEYMFGAQPITIPLSKMIGFTLNNFRGFIMEH